MLVFQQIRAQFDLPLPDPLLRHRERKLFKLLFLWIDGLLDGLITRLLDGLINGLLVLLIAVVLDWLLAALLDRSIAGQALMTRIRDILRPYFLLLMRCPKREKKVNICSTR